MLVKFLKIKQDVFAWSYKDVLGIDKTIIQHRLNVDLAYKPIQQRMRIFTLDRNRAVVKEVDKLLATGFIREMYYPEWLVNVVMVEKANGKWRICVDFTNLNKACLNDSFQLPRID